MLVGLNKGRIVSKYIITVVFLLGLMQWKTEALGKDSLKDRISADILIIRELAVVSKKYKKCSDTKDDKKRLACFDSLTKPGKEREKKYEHIKNWINCRKTARKKLRNN